MALTQEQETGIRKIYWAIFETVKESGPDGAPENMIHLALTSFGVSGALTKQLVDSMVTGGVLTRQNHVLKVK